MEGMRALGVAALLAVLVGACGDSQPVARGQDALPLGGGAEHLRLVGEPAPDLNVLRFEITTGGCGGRPRLGKVDVEETGKAVTVAAHIVRPTVPTRDDVACPAVGIIIPVTVSLSAFLGDRRILDGSCTPPADVLTPGSGDRQPCTPTPEAQAAKAAAGTWKQLDAGPLATRAEAKAVWTGKEMIVLGGDDVYRYTSFDDGAAYNPSTEQWRRIANRPDPGRMLAVAWTGKEVFVLGQRQGTALDNAASVHLFNPTTNTWRASSPIPHPMNMPEGAYWTGREVIVWQMGSGLLYDPAADSWRGLPAPADGANAINGRALWFPTVRRFAVQGAQSPAKGGPLQDTLWLFDPETDNWTAKTPTEQVPQFNLLYASWLGKDAAYDELLYNPETDRWHKTSMAGINRDAGTAYFNGIPIDKGRAAVRVGSTTTPLVMYDSRGDTWTYAAQPPSDRLAFPDGPIIWDGAHVLLFGRPDNAGATDPNTAWAWTPPE